MQLSSCACLGHRVVYECTVRGSGATNWGGTALEECSEGRLLLRHSGFNSGHSRNKTCGSSGHIRSYAVSAENGTYISQLILNVSNNMVDDSITCSGGSEEGVEHAQITLTTGTYINVSYGKVLILYSFHYSATSTSKECQALQYKK